MSRLTFTRRLLAGVRRRIADPAGLLPARGRAPTRTPVVGLVGFYGAGNYGDDLFLEAFREHLGAPLQPRPILDPERRLTGAATLRQRVGASDVVVIGGGDLVIPWRRSRYWRRPLLERPIFIAGVGVPTSTVLPRPDVVGYLGAFMRHPNVLGIAARDADSAAWIRDQLDPRVPVEEIPDLACAVTLPPIERPVDPPIFGVAVRRRDTADDLTNVRRLCAKAVRLGYRLRRIVLATGPLRVRDLEATRNLGFEETELVAVDDLERISRAIGECSMLASMKFHGVVVAALYGVPSIVLMPSAKTRRFAARVGTGSLVSSYSDPGLADLVVRDPPPIGPEVASELHDGASAYLVRLRDRILEGTAAGWQTR